jgi:hypothetical protein
MKLFRSVAFGVSILTFGAFGANTAQAQSVTGLVLLVAGDPSDFVVQLDQNGSCGGDFFHMKRSSANFKEVVAVELTAFSTGRPLTVFVTGCAGVRNIISHGFVAR